MSDQKPSLDEQIQKLDELVAWFEGDDFKLDQASEKYQQAKNLLDNIERGINELEQVFKVIDEQS